MGKRSTGRKLGMQALYQAELRKEDVNNFIEAFLEDAESLDETKDFAKELAQGAWKNKTEIDKVIKKYAIDWDLDRITIIDKSLLRMAFYELIYVKVPARIVVNEMVELAKKFCEDESPKFLNGIVGKFIQENPDKVNTVSKEVNKKK